MKTQAMNDDEINKILSTKPKEIRQMGSKEARRFFRALEKEANKRIKRLEDQKLTNTPTYTYITSKLRKKRQPNGEMLPRFELGLDYSNKQNRTIALMAMRSFFNNQGLKESETRAAFNKLTNAIKSIHEKDFNAVKESLGVIKSYIDDGSGANNDTRNALRMIRAVINDLKDNDYKEAIEAWDKLNAILGKSDIPEFEKARTNAQKAINKMTKRSKEDIIKDAWGVIQRLREAFPERFLKYNRGSDEEIKRIHNEIVKNGRSPESVFMDLYDEYKQRREYENEETLKLVDELRKNKFWKTKRLMEEVNTNMLYEKARRDMESPYNIPSKFEDEEDEDDDYEY